jgi:two-component system sensor histidine kinase KdpD
VWVRYALAAAFVGAMTVVVGVAPTGVSLSHRSPLYFVDVLAAGALLGRGPAILAAVLSFLSFDYFFVDPLHTLAVADPEEWQALLLFLIAAVVTGQLTAQLRDRAEAARQREREALAYYEVRDRLQEERVQGEVLRRTDELRAALLSAVSHDFRTPLAAIKAAAGSLAQAEVAWGGEERRASAAQIEREADRLNRLVENLLDLSRIESGTLKLDRQWYPVRELIEDTVDRLAAPLAGHTAHVEVADDVPPAPLDYVLVQQVLTNLLENAAKYSPAGSAIRVRAGAAPGGGELIVRVEDEGRGLPQGEAARVFAPFYRVTRADGAPATAHGGAGAETPRGAGYGLAVCAGFVAAHGGRIWAERAQGGGAAFVFTIPLTPPQPAAPPE